MSVRRIHFVLALTLILFSTASVLAARARPKTHTVRMEGMRFQPQALTVNMGDTIVWLNKDLVAHTATSTLFDSQIIPPGKSWKFVAASEADLIYVCTLHPGMTATLRVKARS